MLVIRNEQLEVFARRASEDFVLRLARELAAESPAAAALEDEGLIALLTQVVDEGATRGVVTERAFALMAFLRLDYGPGYLDLPWISEILGASNLLMDAKMTFLETEYLSHRPDGN